MPSLRSQCCGPAPGRRADAAQPDDGSIPLSHGPVRGVADIEDVPTAGRPQRWGCGECGSTWPTDAALQRAIADIVNRHPHRDGVYQNDGCRWVAKLLDQQPDDYEAVVESEK